MAFYIQYDAATGNINATVNTTSAPICDNQLEFEGWVPTEGKRVNLSTLELEDIPQE